MLDLTGKIAIVTGASRGIGRAIALTLAARGAVVVAAARGENAAGTAEAIREAGGRSEFSSVDVNDPASVDVMVAATLERHGRIDILVNNAGITRDQLLLRMKRDDWDQVMATNLTAAFTVVQAVLKPMVKQRSGRIVSISSVVGQMVQQGAGARGRVAQHHGQRRDAGADRHGHDEGDHREGAGRLGVGDSAGTPRHGRRSGRGSLFPRLG